MQLLISTLYSYIASLHYLPIMDPVLSFDVHVAITSSELLLLICVYLYVISIISILGNNDELAVVSPKELTSHQRTSKFK